MPILPICVSTAFANALNEDFSKKELKKFFVSEIVWGDTPCMKELKILKSNVKKGNEGHILGVTKTPTIYGQNGECDNLLPSAKAMQAINDVNTLYQETFPSENTIPKITNKNFFGHKYTGAQVASPPFKMLGEKHSFKLDFIGKCNTPGSQALIIATKGHRNKKDYNEYTLESHSANATRNKDKFETGYARNIMNNVWYPNQQRDQLEAKRSGAIFYNGNFCDKNVSFVLDFTPSSYTAKVFVNNQLVKSQTREIPEASHIKGRVFRAYITSNVQPWSGSQNIQKFANFQTLKLHKMKGSGEVEGILDFDQLNNVTEAFGKGILKPSDVGFFKKDYQPSMTIKKFTSTGELEILKFSEW